MNFFSNKKSNSSGLSSRLKNDYNDTISSIKDRSEIYTNNDKIEELRENEISKKLKILLDDINNYYKIKKNIK